jgi:hypothetical protein
MNENELKRRCHVNLLRKHQLRASHASFAAQMVASPSRTYRCSIAKEMCQSQSVVSCYLSPSAHEPEHLVAWGQLPYAKAQACTRARSTKYDAAICIGQLSLVNYMISRLVSSKYYTATNRPDS